MSRLSASSPDPPDITNSPARPTSENPRTPPKPPRNQPGERALTPPDPLTPTTTAAPTMAQPTRLLVASIGNPAPYLNTLHSAGHTVLHSLARSLQAPPLSKSRQHANGLLAAVPAANLTLWQSPSLMNVSGPALAAAWKQFARDSPGADVALVVLHDELESPLGTVKVKSGGGSARGHNGLKSIKEVMGTVAYTRVGVGIGRPSSRESGEVARYVLRKMTGVERAALEGCVGRVEEELARLTGL